MVGSYRSRAIGFRDSHHKEGAVGVDSTDRNPVGEEGRGPVVAEGRREAYYCSLDTRMVGVGLNLGVGGGCLGRR